MSRSLQKACRILFDQMDANCNTCKHLERVAHPKNNAGFLYGRCRAGIPDKDSHPYIGRISEDGVMPFAPSDFMGMTCHQPRGLDADGAFESPDVRQAWRAFACG